MKLIFKFCVFLSLVLVTSSCISHKQFDYAPISSPKDLAGIYVNEEEYPPKIIRVNYVNDKRLEFSTFEDSVWTTPVLYKGKFDKKRNTFERWMHRKILPFILVMGYRYEKDRIGKDKNENLIVNNAYDGLGIVIPLGANNDKGSYITTYKPFKDQILIPVRLNNKWGFKDFVTNDLVIANMYDSVYFYQDALARVKMDDKWGIINKQNDIIVTPKYDQIKPLEEGAMEIINNGKCGLLDSLACEVIPCIYDEITWYYLSEGYRKVNQNGFIGVLNRNLKFVLPCEYSTIEQSWDNRNLFIIEKDKLKGFANGSGVIYPPMFKELEIFSEKRYPNILGIGTNLDDKTYYLDSDGYLYLPIKIDSKESASSPDYKTKFHYTELNND